MLKLDSRSVQCLQLLGPGVSENDKKKASGLVLGGQAFSGFDSKERDSIWKRMKVRKCIVPSLDSFFRDVWYLETCANCVKRLVSLTKNQTTLKGAMANAFSQPRLGKTEYLVQTSEIEFRTYQMSDIDPADFAYRQIWLFAMRHYPKMTKEPKDKDQLVKRREKADQNTLFEMALLARKLGYKSQKISDLLKESPDKQIAREALLKARKPHLFTFNEDQFESIVERVVQCFDMASPQRGEPEPLAVDHREAPLKGRYGTPQDKNQRQDRRFLFLNRVHSSAPLVSDKITSLFVRISVYFKFFGGQGFSFENDVSNRSISPLFVPSDEHITKENFAYGKDKDLRRNQKSRRKHQKEPKSRTRAQNKKRPRAKDAVPFHADSETDGLIASSDEELSKSQQDCQASSMDEDNNQPESTPEHSHVIQRPRENSEIEMSPDDTDMESTLNQDIAGVETFDSLGDPLNTLDGQDEHCMETENKLEAQPDTSREKSPNDSAMADPPSEPDSWPTASVETIRRSNSIAKKDKYRRYPRNFTTPSQDSRRSRSPDNDNLREFSGQGGDNSHNHLYKERKKRSFLEEHQKSLEREIDKLTTPSESFPEKSSSAAQQVDARWKSQTKENGDETGKEYTSPSIAPLTTSAAIFTPPTEPLGEPGKDGTGKERELRDARIPTQDCSSLEAGIERRIASQEVETLSAASFEHREHNSRRGGVVFGQSASGLPIMGPNHGKKIPNVRRSAVDAGGEGEIHTSPDLTEELVESQPLGKPENIAETDGWRANEKKPREIRSSVNLKRPIGYLGYSKEIMEQRPGEELKRPKASLRKPRVAERTTKIDFKDFTGENGDPKTGTQQFQDAEVPSEDSQTLFNSTARPQTQANNGQLDGSVALGKAAGYNIASNTSQPKSLGKASRIPIVFKGRNDRGEWKEIIHREMVDPSNPLSVETFAREKAKEQAATFYDRNLRQIAPANCFEAAVRNGGMNTIFMAFGSDLTVNQAAMESVSRALSENNEDLSSDGIE